MDQSHAIEMVGLGGHNDEEIHIEEGNMAQSIIKEPEVKDESEKLFDEQKEAEENEPDNKSVIDMKEEFSKPKLMLSSLSLVNAQRKRKKVQS